MKRISIFLILFCFVFPVFSQTNSANAQRFSALSDSMGTTVSKSNVLLEDFNSQIKDDGDVKVYTSYKRKYESMVKALQDSEYLLNLYLRTNERTATIKAERDNYENLINQLQQVKSEFDNYLRSAR